MNIYNTQSKKLETLKPRNPGVIQMFVCGPTVYDLIHIGNARTFVFFDMVAKYLKHKGYELKYIQNITDIDDKIIQRATKENTEPLDLARDYTEKFKSDMESLGVTSPIYAPATIYINEVLQQVKALIDKGFAYEIKDDGWYFDLSKFPSYGKLSGRTTQMADDAISRIDDNNKKKNTGDFAIWKFSKEGEPSWDPSEMGFPEISSGRPGWHIEDTAITDHFFGPQYDIHGGGQDLMFPHHEAEIAQQESASGKSPFVSYWMHVAFVVNSEAKMSKSAGNFQTVRDLLEVYPKEVIRFYLLANHYRTPLQFSEQMLSQSQAGVQRISEFITKLKLANGNKNESIQEILDDAYKKFFDSLDDDFNTSGAISSIFDTIRAINPLLTSNDLSAEDTDIIKSFLDEIDEIIGILPREESAVPSEIQILIQERESARSEKDFSQADKIRDTLRNKGWTIEDTIYGPLAKKK